VRGTEEDKDEEDEEEEEAWEGLSGETFKE
jgi:hypothetical protein